MEARQSKIVLFSEDQGHIHQLESLLNRHQSHKFSVDVCPIKVSTEEIFLRYTPDILIVDLSSYDSEQQDYILTKLERIAEMTPVVGIIRESQRAEALSYIKRGIRDMIESPFHELEVIKTLGRFHKIADRGSLKKNARVFTFFSFKGGVGNTFVTINTAANMAKVTKKKVLLWDMALQAGDIPFFLNFQPEYTLSDLVNNVEQIDETYLNGVLPPHACGVSILPAPAKIEDIEKLTPAEVEKILGIFSQHFDYIFIDAGYRLTDAIIPLIDASSYFFITTTLELIALRSASRCLDILEKLNFPPDKIKIVVNRFSSKHEAITIEKAKKILKFNMVQFIQNDYEISSKSVNLGQTVIEVAPGSGIDKQFREFAEKIASNFDETKNNKRVFQIFSAKLKKAISHGA